VRAGLPDRSTVGERSAAALAGVGLPVDLVVDRVREALAEDLAYGPDVTTAATVPADQSVRAVFATRTPGVLAGVGIARVALDLVIGPDAWRERAASDDGTRLDAGAHVLDVEAPTRGLLTAERTALNFVGHLSGVATLTAEWARAVHPARVRDTRKTVPGFRVLEKYAVRCGGGLNHRMGLGDAALIKDNHVVSAGGIAAAVAAVRAAAPSIPLEVECDSFEQVLEAIASGVDLVLLDNMDAPTMRRCVEAGHAAGGDVRFEASGGLTLATAREVADTGVDYVAVGRLTHSAPVLDIGLDVVSVLPSVGSASD
jgi:nicotinate-nucleotide pyrophosphorylase (carboxylating)